MPRLFLLLSSLPPFLQLFSKFGDRFMFNII